MGVAGPAISLTVGRNELSRVRVSLKPSLSDQGRSGPSHLSHQRHIHLTATSMP